ncbi:uncharacterized protein ACIBXB_021534 [Morphnus guianensis]
MTQGAQQRRRRRCRCCHLVAKSAVLQPGVRVPALAPPARRRRPAHARSLGAAWRRAGRGSRRQRVSAGTAEATLWVRLSVGPLGMPLAAAASGLRGPSLPGLPLLAAQERRGAGGALTGCGQELLKLERLQKAAWYGHVVSKRARLHV